MVREDNLEPGLRHFQYAQPGHVPFPLKFSRNALAVLPRPDRNFQWICSLFANREYRISDMTLKPQDVMVALKICSYRTVRPPISAIAADLSLSSSEVHAALKRLNQAHLLHGPELQNKPNITALEEFLIHGLKYAFPAEHGSATRGMPTSYAAAPLKGSISAGDELPPVWPFPEGDTRGIALQPLYRTAPTASLRDPLLYEYLSLLDAIRDGRVRERKVAERELIKRLHSVNAKP